MSASVDDLRAAKRLGRQLFGDAMNIFFQGGLWHFGRFLDGKAPISGKSKYAGEVHPAHRPQEVFGVHATLRGAMRFATGPERVYSGPGMAPGIGSARGYRVIFDKRGRVHGYESPAGIFSKHFPGEPGNWS